jgi:hypothetical protein
MTGWMDEIQRNAKERGERPKVHAHFAVHDHRFVCAGGCIDPNISPQKVFSLRIVGSTEHFPNKNVSAPGHGKQPEDYAENESHGQKIRRPVAVSDLHRREYSRLKCDQSRM